MIPRILHQTWKSKTSFPVDFDYWRKSFLDCNPGIDYRLYDDGDNRSLVGELFPGLLPIYDEFPREIFRADFIRPIYLFKFGGLYADMDFQCLKEFSWIFSKCGELVLGMMGTDRSFPQCLPNAMMAAVPGEGFWLGFLANIEISWKTTNMDLKLKLCPENLSLDNIGPENITGPGILFKTVDQYLTDLTKFKKLVFQFIDRYKIRIESDDVRFSNLAILPGHFWYPLNWRDKIHFQYKENLKKETRLLSLAEARKIFPSSFAVTYWTCVHKLDKQSSKSESSR